MNTVPFAPSAGFPGMGFSAGGFSPMPMGGTSFGGFQPALGSLMQTAGGLPTGMPGFGAASFSQCCCPCFGGQPGGSGLEQSMMMMTQMMALMMQFLGTQLLGGGATGGTDPNAMAGAAPVGGAAPSSGGGSGAPASGGAAPAGGTGGAAPANDTKDEGEIKAFIAQAAQAYGADPKVLTEMARRESNFKTGVVNDWDSNAKKGVPSKGLFQFIEPTFKSYAPKAKAANPQAWAGMGDFDWNDWRQQALTAAWAVKAGHGSAWTTYKAAGGH